jgi:hypothetical protein
MSTPGSYYVRRVRSDGRVGWTGSVRPRSRAEREATAWNDAGWTAEMVPNTPEVRAEVRRWATSRKKSA